MANGKLRFLFSSFIVFTLICLLSYKNNNWGNERFIKEIPITNRDADLGEILELKTLYQKKDPSLSITPDHPEEFMDDPKISLYEVPQVQFGSDTISPVENDMEQVVSESVEPLPDDNPMSMTTKTPATSNTTTEPKPPVSSTELDLGKLLQETASKFMELMTSTTKVHLSAEQLQNQADAALEKQKRDIDKAMKDYSFDTERNSSLPKGKWKPIRNIIFTTWRSGSTFLGEAITSYPAMFYHYEPLLHFDIVQVRSGPLAQEGLRVLNKLLRCDYSDLNDYLEYGRNHSYLHSHNWRLFNHCQQNENEELCTNADFLSKMCSLFPFQIMKTVRMRLKLAESLILDEELDVRVLLLVRDPRGTIQSRKHRVWCPGNPDCDSPLLLCKDMVDDYHSALLLKDKYPDKIMIIRYEELSLSPKSGIHEVLEFFRLDADNPLVSKFIDTHTVNTVGGVSSTFRDSKSTPFKWKEYFQNNTKELERIQRDCDEALRLWGYDKYYPKSSNRVGKKKDKPKDKDMNNFSNPSFVSSNNSDTFNFNPLLRPTLCSYLMNNCDKYN